MSEYLNITDGLARVRGNKKIFRKMLGMFLDSKEFAAFEESLAQKDYSKSADIAHAIKGMTGNLALTPLFDSSTELMHQLYKGSANPETLEAYRTILENTRADVVLICSKLDQEIAEES